MELGAEADQVGQLADGGGVAERGEALDAERVEVVAGEQGEVGVVPGEQARLAVVEEVALADRLDDERVLGGRRAARGAGRGEEPEGGSSVGSTTCAEIGVSSSRSWAARARSASAGSLIRAPRSSDSAAASRVRSIASSSWARETNQASNWEGGG